MAGPAIVQPSVGAALRFVRENWQLVLRIALIGAVASALVASLSLIAQSLGVIGTVGSGIVQAFVYAALIGLVLYGATATRTRFVNDGWRVWLAMVVIGFFLFFVFFVLSIPVMMVLIAGPLAPYITELQAAEQNQAEVLAILTRFAETNPGVIMLLLALFFSLWLALTSRLYLAAPATVDQGRLRTFETWRWTKGSMLKIAGARLMLLIPANILTGAVSYVIGRLVGIDTSSMAATGGGVGGSPIGFVVYIFCASFATFALYCALEAALSTALYRALKPQPPPPAA